MLKVEFCKICVTLLQAAIWKKLKVDRFQTIDVELIVMNTVMGIVSLPNLVKWLLTQQTLWTFNLIRIKG